MELTESTKFIIRSVENKIVVLANTQKWLEEAVNYLCTQYIQSDTEETNVSLINHTEFSEETLLMNKNHQLQFVLPNNISDHFTECAKAMIDSLNVDEFTLVTQSEYTSDHAIYIGTVTSDPISVSYADIINKNEYTARLAANNIYLQGENEILTLMSLGEFLTKLNKHLDYDFEGNLCISLPDTVNFSKTWNYSIPKPIKGNLENCESISADTHVYHFNSVSKDAFALYKHQLHAIGFHADPIVSNYYQTENMTAVLSYSPTESIMSVTIAPKGDPRAS